MIFDTYKKLKKLALKCGDAAQFIQEAAKWPRRYAVVTPKIWTKADYEWFYNQIKGGQNYATLFKAA